MTAPEHGPQAPEGEAPTNQDAVDPRVLTEGPEREVVEIIARGISQPWSDYERQARSILGDLEAAGFTVAAPAAEPEGDKQREFLAAHGERMARVDDALAEAREGRRVEDALTAGEWVYCETEGVRTDVRCKDDCGCAASPAVVPAPRGLARAARTYLDAYKGPNLTPSDREFLDAAERELRAALSAPEEIDPSALAVAAKALYDRPMWSELSTGNRLILSKDYAKLAIQTYVAALGSAREAR